MPWSLKAVCSFQLQLGLCLALFSLEKQSQSNVCTVNTIKLKSLEMSKAKLDNMCFDAEIWSLKVKKTVRTAEVCICFAPVQHISILLTCLRKFSLKSVCSVFLKYHHPFQTSFGLKQVSPKVRILL